MSIAALDTLKSLSSALSLIQPKATSDGNNPLTERVKSGATSLAGKNGDGTPPQATSPVASALGAISTKAGGVNIQV